MKKIVNMMIYKEIGNSSINHLRVIYTYEADILLLPWKKLTEAILHAQKEGIMHPGQFVGLPGRDCTEITVLKEAQMDYSLFTRLTLWTVVLILWFAMTKYCVLSLISKKYGVNKQVIFVHAKTLQEEIYGLNLSTKVSKTGYKHIIEFSINGTWQGSINSPMI